VFPEVVAVVAAKTTTVFAARLRSSSAASRRPTLSSMAESVRKYFWCISLRVPPPAFPGFFAGTASL